jgi:hypothetical protein
VFFKSYVKKACKKYTVQVHAPASVGDLILSDVSLITPFHVGDRWENFPHVRERLETYSDKRESY